MGLYDFKPQFVPFIKAGTKKHTIRSKRKYPDKPGDKLYLYVGLRTKKARRIAIVTCSGVDDIEFKVEERGLERIIHVYIDGEELTASEREHLARADGFRNFAEMMRFWKTPKNRLPFRGDIIHWR